MRLNSFCVRVYRAGHCIHWERPQRATAAVMNYEKLIKKYFSEITQEAPTQIAGMNGFSDEFLEMLVRRWKGNPNTALRVAIQHRGVSSKGNIQVEFIHESLS